ncbi:MAG TPA: TIGR03086 family metal-binding protein [Acidimicrobiia bacterium]|nr:TIGR03086 family metal-binding protein [Acidimicrobiia bacterium]
MAAADEHRLVAAGFTRLVRGVPPGGWDAPAPVDGWVARDVVRHLLDWLPGFLSVGAGIELAIGISVDADPVAAWETRARAVQDLLEDPDTAGREFESPHLGEMTVEAAIDGAYTVDVFLHSWDLARATGQDETLDPQRCRRVLDRMRPFEAAMRDSGQFGPRVDVPDDAGIQAQLLGFIGRDPFQRT